MATEFLTKLGCDLRDRLTERDIELAHLKMTLSPDTGNDLAVGNLVRNQSNVELSHELAEPVEEGFSVAQSSRRGRSRATEASGRRGVTQAGLNYVWKSSSRISRRFGREGRNPHTGWSEIRGSATMGTIVVSRGP